MSFIDYNFFPILFFLGWNILTTKQLKPITYQTSDVKTWSVLPIFPLTNQREETNSKFQKILQANSKHEKGSNILEFVPGFRFLRASRSTRIFEDSKNTAARFFIPRIKKRACSRVDPHSVLTGSENPRSFYGFEEFSPNFGFSPYKSSIDQNSDTGFLSSFIRFPFEIKHLNSKFKHRIRSGYHHFTNYNLIHHNWKKHIPFRSPLFDFSYRLNQNKFISSFISDEYNGSSEIKSWFNHGFVFSKEFENGVFFGGLGFRNNRFFWQRVQKQLKHAWFLKKKNFLQTDWFFSLFGLKNQTKSAKKNVFKSETGFSQTKKTSKKNPDNDYNSMFKSYSFFTIRANQKQVFKINAIQKRRSKIRLLLRIPVQKIYSLNKFQTALCLSKILQPSTRDSRPVFVNDSYPFSLSSKVNDSIFIKEKFKPSTSILENRFFDTRFANHHQDTSYEFKSRLLPDEFPRGLTVMKTGFFQHMAWNMKHKNFDPRYPLMERENLESEFNPTSLSGYHHKEIRNEIPREKQLLTMYGGSWYYENALFPYSIFTTLAKTPSLSLQPEHLGLNSNCSTNKTLEPLRRRIHTPFLRRKKFEFDIGIYSLAHKLSSVGLRNSNASTDIYPFKYNDSYRYNFQNMTLSNHRLKNFLIKQDSISTNGQKNPCPFLDFQNPTFSKIYAPVFQPQGLNLLSFLSNSFLNVIPTERWNKKPVNRQSVPDFFSPSASLKDFLFNDFSLAQNRLLTPFWDKNPKIQHGISFCEMKPGIHVFSQNKIKSTAGRASVIENDSYCLTDSKKIDKPFKTLLSREKDRVRFKTSPKRLKTFRGIYHKLPVNGIHGNPYPWITQNAYDRWSNLNDIASSLSFFEIKPKYPKESEKQSVLTTSFNNGSEAAFSFEDSPIASAHLVSFGTKNTRGNRQAKPDPLTFQKHALKNFNSQLYFKQQPSCIKKPSIFFFIL